MKKCSSEMHQFELADPVKLVLNAKCSLSLRSKLGFGHRKWFLITNLFLIFKFDCTLVYKYVEAEI